MWAMRLDDRNGAQVPRTQIRRFFQTMTLRDGPIPSDYRGPDEIADVPPNFFSTPSGTAGTSRFNRENVIPISVPEGKSYPPVEFREVRTELETDEALERDIHLACQMNKGGDGHLTYTLPALKQATFMGITFFRRFFSDKSDHVRYSLGESIMELRYYECNSAVTRSIYPGQRHLSYALISAVTATANRVYGIKTIVYDQELYFGGGMLLDETATGGTRRQVVWPQDKSMARLVQHSFEIPNPNVAYLNLDHRMKFFPVSKPSLVLDIEESLSPIGRMLFRTVSVRTGSNLDDVPDLVCVDSLSDVVSSIYVLLKSYYQIENDFDFGKMQVDFELFQALLADRNPYLTFAIKDLCELVRRGEAYISEHLQRTAAHCFFLCNVFDTMRWGNSLEDSLHRAGTFSRAVYFLILAGVDCSSERCSAYGIFMPEEASRVKSYLCSLVSEGGDYNKRQLTPADMGNTAETPLEAPRVLNRQETQRAGTLVGPDGAGPSSVTGASFHHEEGRPITKSRNVPGMYKTLPQLESRYVRNSDFVRLGVGVFPKKVNKIQKQKCKISEAECHLEITARFKKRNLTVNVNYIMSDRVYEEVRAARMKRDLGKALHWEISGDTVQNVSSVRSELEMMLNAFISGDCGHHAALWALDRLVKGDIVVSSRSTSFLTRFLGETEESWEAPVLIAPLAPSIVSTLPMLFNPDTEKALLYLDKTLPLRQVVFIAPCKVGILPGEVSDLSGFRKCILEEGFEICLA